MAADPDQAVWNYLDGVPDLPNMSIRDLVRDCYRIDRGEKYLGIVRFDRDNGWYTAWSAGREIAASRTLLGAAKAFEAIQ